MAAVSFMYTCRMLSIICPLIELSGMKVLGFGIHDATNKTAPTLKSLKRKDYGTRY